MLSASISELETFLEGQDVHQGGHTQIAVELPLMDAAAAATQIVGMEHEPAAAAVDMGSIDVPPAVSHVVRVGYLIPSNRTPHPDGVENLQTLMRWGQDWFRQGMERNGFGPKTFTYETEADGVTPN